MNGMPCVRDKTKRMSLSSKLGACVVLVAARTRGRSKTRQRQHRLLLEINVQFMEIAGMYRNWLATRSRYAGDHPQVLEWLLVVLTRMKSAYVYAYLWRRLGATWRNVADQWTQRGRYPKGTRGNYRNPLIFRAAAHAEGVFFGLWGAFASLRETQGIEDAMYEDWVMRWFCRGWAQTEKNNSVDFQRCCGIVRIEYICIGVAGCT